MKLEIPELSLVVLMGASGSGKSSFAKKHFAQYETVSSDECRGIIANDPNSLKATTPAFELLRFILRKRLSAGLLTVVDATNVQPEARKSLLNIAREYHCLPVAIVLDLPQSVSEERNANRPDRNFGNHVLRQQKQQLRRSLKGLKREGFRKIYVLKSEEEVDAITGIEREKLYNDKKDVKGPFDIIGDIHGCYDELLSLLQKLGYVLANVPDNGQNFGLSLSHPEGRQPVFLGDLVDRGPKSPEVLRLVMSVVRSGTGWCVPGNHDLKLQKKLKGKDVAIKHGLAETLAQMEGESPEFLKEVEEFLYSLVSHYLFDEGRLAVAHAGIREEMQGRGSGAVRAFCLYGETTGEIDEFGLPVRHNWASEYRGKTKVVYGHTPVPEAEWLNNTIDIDTGCVFGGKLTALRYPEQELISVPALSVYCEPVRPLQVKQEQILSHQQVHDDLLNIEDVTGKRIIQTRLRHNLTIKEENSIAALEVMSRFAINPKWLIYLPPTMSPCETSIEEAWLEHPTEAIGYYKKRGIKKLICEEKHMGSRAILVVCKDEEAALTRFGVKDEGLGVCYTRTGRGFFKENAMQAALIERVAQALTKIDFWKEHNTDWVCLDMELMPWSAKAQALIRDQYAAVGAAASQALPLVQQALSNAKNRGVEGISQVLDRFSQKQKNVAKFIEAYRAYCWEVDSLDDFKLAPFHIMATEGQVYTNKDHGWHMEQISRLKEADSNFFKDTACKLVDTESQASIEEATNWWMQLTEQGGEGMVVKPMDFLSYGKEGLLQPAVKCRGREYLRIIYGPDYDHPKNLERLKKRSLSRKRSLAIREFALGIESLERFVNKEPLRRIHESAFAVLALESEELDPRL